jgi:peptide/nickel transport system substrate-binding protein
MGGDAAAPPTPATASNAARQRQAAATLAVLWPCWRPGQLHSNPTLATAYIWLNTRVPPFNDVRVRQALNYAVDRNRMATLAGGALTCQVLPPNFEGYRRFCPYTIQPSPNGTHTGPNVAKAKRLVAASGTRGQTVTLWIHECCVGLGPAYVVAVLRHLGYKARLKVIRNSFDLYVHAATDSRRKTQAGGWQWLADYPSAGTFFPPLFTCDSFHPNTSTHNFNWSEFCNPRIDAEIARARTVQETDPRAASLLWSKVDRDVTLQAPWLPYGNTQQVDFVSSRVRNYQYNPQWYVLLDQLWVR